MEVSPACGDGELNQDSEVCDDGNSLPGDGCNGICQVEDGWECPEAREPCISTYVCGNGVLDRCDDGNLIPGDGCDIGCPLEPTCTPGEGCTSACGDGLVISPETCDDGNLVDGDGCSSACTVEPGFECSNDAPYETVDGTCVMRVPIVYRDFIGSNFSGHSDFQVSCGTTLATTGLVADTLRNGVPVLASAAGAVVWRRHRPNGRGRGVRRRSERRRLQ